MTIPKRRSLLPTYEIAMAAGRDAGNASLKAAGRKSWDETDFNVAADRTQRLMAIAQAHHRAFDEPQSPTPY